LGGKCNLADSLGGSAVKKKQKRRKEKKNKNPREVGWAIRV
jgi:hypothetical protein